MVNRISVIRLDANAISLDITISKTKSLFIGLNSKE